MAGRAGKIVLLELPFHWYPGCSFPPFFIMNVVAAWSAHKLCVQVRETSILSPEWDPPLHLDQRGMQFGERFNPDAALKPGILRREGHPRESVNLRHHIVRLDRFVFARQQADERWQIDRKSTRLNSSH